MDVAPLRIECIDVSHVQGTDVVASLVVFEDGLPKRSDYRRFAIRDRPGDDVASIAEVVRRRFTHGAGPVGGRAAAPGAGGADPPIRAPPGRRRRPGRPSRTDGEPTYRRGIDPRDRPAAPVRLPAAAAGGRRRRSAGQRGRDRAGRAGHRRRHDLRAGQAAGGGLGARRRTSRSSSRAPARRSTCCSGCGTRRTGSPSPTTARSGRSR